jgi:hypothetical protein
MRDAQICCPNEVGVRIGVDREARRPLLSSDCVRGHCEIFAQRADLPLFR